MSQSPAEAALSDPSHPSDPYGRAFRNLANKIRDGQSFSGRERNVCLLNLPHTGKFSDASALLGLDQTDDARGSATMDWDGDGDLDLLVSNRTAPRLRILRNDQPNLGHWLTLELEGDASQGVNRDAIGACITVRRGTELPVLTRSVTAGDGFLSQSSLRVHFGLGSEIKAKTLVQVVIRWPNGKTSEPAGLTVDTAWQWKYGQQPERLVRDTLPQLEAAKPPPKVVSGPLHTRVYQPLPFPAPAQATNSPGQPYLLLLYAPGCQACGTERPMLEKLTASLGVRLIAVPVGTGMLDEATKSLAASIEGVIDRVIYRRRPLPVPLTLLMDGKGRVRSFCRGPSQEADWQADWKLLSQDESAWRAHTVGGGPQAGLSLLANRTEFPSNPPAVSAAWREIGDLPRAARVLEEYLATSAQAHPTLRAEVEFRLAEIYLAANKPAKALEHLAKARALQPQLLVLRLAEVQAHAQLGDAEAVQAAVQALHGTPAYPDALLHFSDFQQVQGQWAESLATLRQATKLNPRFVKGLHSLANLLLTCPQKDLQNAVEALQLVDYFLQAPGAADNPEYLLTQALALKATGNVETAANLLAKVTATATNRGLRKLLERCLAARSQVTEKGKN